MSKQFKWIKLLVFFAGGWYYVFIGDYTTSAICMGTTAILLDLLYIKYP
jgi:hypothetical protein